MPATARTAGVPRRGDLAKPITYRQFLIREMDNHVEWVDGRVVPMHPVTDEHADVARFLSALLSHFVEARDLGVIRCEPFQMKTGSRLPGRAPDILFIANANRTRLKRTHLEGPADLVVEIVSPGSRTRDRREKFREYQQGGVREYWVIDPARRQAEVFALDRGGVYKKVPTASGVLRSVVLDGLWLRSAWLWRRPKLMQVLREWGLA